MAIPPIGPNFTAPITSAGSFAPPTSVTQPQAPDGQSFGAKVAGALEQLNQTQANADQLAVKAATGELKDVHEFTIAATQAQLALDLTVAVRNKAVDAFNEIMRMPI